MKLSNLKKIKFLSLQENELYQRFHINFIRCVFQLCILCPNVIRLRANSDFQINFDEKKVAEKRKTIQVRIPRKLEPI